MANWCINKIKIEGAKKYLDKLENKLIEFESNAEQSEKEILLMEYLIGLGKIPQDYYDQGQYQHNKKRFGTGVDIPLWVIETILLEDNKVFIDTSSHWTPIIPFMSKLCMKYNVKGSIDYFEYGQDFGGRAIIDTNGDVQDNRYSYHQALFLFENETFWNKIENDVDDWIGNELDEYLEMLPFIDNRTRAEIEEQWKLKNGN